MPSRSSHFMTGWLWNERVVRVSKGKNLIGRGCRGPCVVVTSVPLVPSVTMEAPLEGDWREEVSSQGYFGGISSILIMILSFLVSRPIKIWRIQRYNRHWLKVDNRWDMRWKDTGMVENDGKWRFWRGPRGACHQFWLKRLTFWRIDQLDYSWSNGAIAIIADWIVVEICDEMFWKWSKMMENACFRMVKREHCFNLEATSIIFGT